MITYGKVLGRKNDTMWTVRVPIFESAGITDKQIFDCVSCSDNTIKKDDTVVISFVENELSRPIILGKLYTELESKEEKDLTDITTLKNQLNDQKTVIDNKSKVSVSNSGTAIQGFEYITIDGEEYKMPEDANELKKSINMYWNTHNGTLRVNLNRFTSDDIGKKIWLYKTTRYWNKGFKHPENIDSTSKSYTKFGYGVIAGSLRDNLNTKYYPAVPAWMPNNGYVQTEWILSASDISRGYFDINIERDWVSTLSEAYRYPGKWNQIVGSGNCSHYKSSTNGCMKVKFALIENDKPVIFSTDTFYFGVQINTDDEIDLFIVDSSDRYLLKLTKMYGIVK